MAQLGSTRNFYDKFRFLISIDGFNSAGFTKCSALEAEIAKIEHYEGGSVIPDKSPGRVSYADITLERGATDDLDAWNWFNDVIDASSLVSGLLGAGLGIGLPKLGYKRDLQIIQQDRDGTVLRRWEVRGAWVQKFVAGEWDNDADEKVMEALTLTYDYFVPVAP